MGITNAAAYCDSLGAADQILPKSQTLSGTSSDPALADQAGLIGVSLEELDQRAAAERARSGDASSISQARLLQSLLRWRCFARIPRRPSKESILCELLTSESLRSGV
jgi:hypothetical protein